MLFHYHFWTPYVEETEKFYEDHGFRISQRIGKLNGDFQTFNPPLKWDEFRDRGIIFRIIEARRGNVNITFGYGKKIMFDHIGFLVSAQQHKIICNKAKEMDWNVKIDARRTFITTPYDFKIELQTNYDVVDFTVDDEAAVIEKLYISTEKEGLEDHLSTLFTKPISSIVSLIGNEVTIQKAIIKGFSSKNNVCPNGVKIFNIHHDRS